MNEKQLIQWGELMRVEGLSMAPCDVTTMNSPHIFLASTEAP